MNKKEIAELRKLFKPETTAIDFVVNVYVTRKEDGVMVLSVEKNRLLAMEEPDMLQRLELSKKTLSGSLEKNLLSVDIPTSECIEDGCQDRLYKLLHSHFDNQDKLDELIEIITKNADINAPYMIQLVHGCYDVVSKKTEESEEVYEYMICSLCPMTYVKTGLGYNAAEHTFKPVPKTMIAGQPVAGFLYPAFNERSSDINQVLFYTKKPNEVPLALIEAITGGKQPVPADVQQKLFQNMIRAAIGDTDFETMKQIHEEVRVRIDGAHFAEKDTKIGKDDIKNILKSACPDIDETAVDEAYEKIMTDYDDSSLALENITDTTKFDVSVPDITIKAKPDKVSHIEQKLVDGKKCFVIPVYGNIAINGVNVTEQ